MKHFLQGLLGFVLVTGFIVGVCQLIVFGFPHPAHPVPYP